ncbi:MAG TPA: hypothetical protein DDW71_00530 [Lactobacillus sp.]|nr:hypothetical protein [Lactobacillus sp.]
MHILIIAISAIVIVFVLRIITTKSHLNEAKKLQQDFMSWSGLDDDSNTAVKETVRPNNHVFVRLYKLVYPNEKDPIVNTVDEGTFHGYPTIFTNQASVTGSFPTKHQSVIGMEVAILQNFVDYFYDQYRQNFRLSYWINFLIFLPQQFLSYLGVKKESVASKLVNVIYWCAVALYSIYKPLLQNLLNHFFK